MRNLLYSTSEISQIIKDLNPNKSSDFSPRILNLHKHVIAPVFKISLNNCMRSGIFLDELHDSLEFAVNKKISLLTEDIETLFVTK